MKIDAAGTGDVEEVTRLISLGADVNHKCQTTALCSATLAGNIEVIKILIEADADRDKRRHKGYFNPLLYAAYGGNFDIVKMLVEAGANINVRA